MEDEQARALLEPARPADPRLGSPQQTWQVFVGAMRGGDRDLAVSCLTSTALEESGPPIASLPKEALLEAANAFGRVEIGGDFGPFRTARARTNGRTKWILFERTRNGEWKIAAM
jgi:hypothetical protein